MTDCSNKRHCTVRRKNNEGVLRGGGGITKIQ